MTRLALGSLALALSAVGCGVPTGRADADVASLPKSVVGGAINTTIAASVALIDFAGRFRCSASLIAPRLVLSAAHCFVDGEALPSVSFASNAQAPFQRAAAVEIHPGFEVTGSFGSRYEHDLALLFLSNESAVEPLSVSTQPPEEGAVVEVVGYGRAEPDTENQGFRHSGTSKVIAVEEEAFTVGPAPAQPCLFDSGGPVLSDEGQIHGVISTGDRQCSSSTRVMRADLELAWIQRNINASDRRPTQSPQTTGEPDPDFDRRETASCSFAAGRPRADLLCWMASSVVAFNARARARRVRTVPGNMMMKQVVLGIFGAVVGLLFGGVLGTVAAGNCATNLRVGSQAGYEVGGWGGVLLGAVLGCLLGLRFGRRRAT